ncbi:MAG TPA: outer membrane beta-barrel protein [Sedimentisphaerales bacterium]|nr:outer membrane beta-barrel protein [Sedimentisphaerales bacterium]HRS11447.1 outer membrane beta-barrel protein [Sedimentisphaerales bacterium]HRV48015.1 outer membrane beta-barrel protein [Sedimentisphaerales bacterium]
MDARGFVKGLVVVLSLAVLALAGTGCSTGSGLECGVFGSSLDSDDLGEGYGGGAKVEINPIDILSIDARASWIHFDDTHVDMIPLEAAALLNFPILFEHIVPYIGAGGGYYFFDADEADLDDEVGFFPLAGLEIGFHKVSILAEARWLFLEADVDSAEEELENITEADVDGLGINVGLLFRL